MWTLAVWKAPWNSVAAELCYSVTAYSKHERVMWDMHVFSTRCALNEVRRLVDGGFLLVGLPCSSFCAPPLGQKQFKVLCTKARTVAATYDVLHACALRSAGTHERSVLFPSGNLGYPSVALGNLLCSRSCLLLHYAAVKGVIFLLEQPARSLAEEFPRLRQLMRTMVKIFSTSIWHGIYGGSSPKRQKLYSNSLRLLFNLEQKAGRVEAGCFQELRGVELVSRKRRADGSLAWTGNENLRSSQFLASMLMSFCGACVHIGQSFLRRYR